MAKILYYGVTSGGLEAVNEIYDLFFVRQKEEYSQEEFQKLIEDYERIFGK
jgi:hypothetical protein